MSLEDDSRYARGYTDGSREWRDKLAIVERELYAVIDLMIIGRSPMNGGGYRVETPEEMPVDVGSYSEGVATVRRIAGLEERS